MIIDSHAHPFGNPNVDLRGKIRSQRDAVLLRVREPDTFRQLWSNPHDLTEEMLNDMDANGIEKALIQTAPGENLDFLAAALRKHPTRFFGMCSAPRGITKRYSNSAPVMDEDVTRAMLDDFDRILDYQIKTLGFRGVGEGVNYVFTQAAETSDIVRDLLPVMEVLDQHRVPIMFSTAWTQFGTPIDKAIPYFVDELAAAFPQVPIILTKMGRGYDFLFEICLFIAFKHTNVYLDSVQAPARHIARAVKEIGADRVLFGSDWDLVWRELGQSDGQSNIYSNALAVLRDAGLSQEDQDWVLRRTATELYQL
jgi:predicted TIM-barrel fold metal-dependent hydrolase